MGQRGSQRTGVLKHRVTYSLNDVEVTLNELEGLNVF